MRRSLAYLCAIVLLGSSGCSLYFGDDECLYGGPFADQAPAPTLRNPYTGQCESYGGWGGCDPACGLCDQPAEAAMPSWGYCESYCSYLDETTCLAAAGCRGAYTELGGFYECWAVDQTGPVQGGICEDSDAWTCSQHDDCIAIHESSCSTDPATGNIICTPGEFVGCRTEPTGCFTDDECAEGQRCNATETCLPAPGCGGASPSDPAAPGAPAPACDAMCYGFCERAPHPGYCEGEILCDLPPPPCPPDSQPGIIDGCWSGQCLSVFECSGPIPTTCGAITDEALCISRPDCDALYEGTDCTCDDAGNCQCNAWTFAGCASI